MSESTNNIKNNNLKTESDLQNRYNLLLSEFEKVTKQLEETNSTLNNIFHSTSWKITKPLREFAVIKRAIFPLYKFSNFSKLKSKDFSIEYKDLEIQETNFQKKFIACGKVPYCSWERKDKKLFDSGWYRLNFNVSNSTNIHLSFDFGEGFSDAGKRFIPLTTSLPFCVINSKKAFKKIRVDFPFSDKPFLLDIESVKSIGTIQALMSLVKLKLGAHPKYWLPKIVKGYKLIKSAGFLALIFKLRGDEPTANYNEWIAENDTLTVQDLEEIKLDQLNLKYQPKFSIIIPTYNTPKVFLEKTINSVINQTYTNWEICICDDASTDPDVRKTIENFSNNDNRIKFKFRDQNGHISATSNDALKLATGDFIALLDHDDELRPHALYMNAVALNKNSDLKLIYSDEDKIDENGNRFNPYFKSDWNPQFFLQQNFICHFTVIKKEIIDSVGGFRVGFEGSQDWDLFLRVIEKISLNEIFHIPTILYHWRAISGSTAQSASFKPYAIENAKKAVNEFLIRNSIKAKASIIEGINQIRVQYELTKTPKVSIIIPTKDQGKVLERCITSIYEKNDYKNFDVTIIDNNSIEPLTQTIFETLKSKYSNLKVIKDNSPFNFSRINNEAVKQTDGEYLAFLNNDLEVINIDWLSQMVSCAIQPNTGAVGAKLWYPNELLQHAGVILGINGVAGHAHKGQPKGHFGYFNRSILVQNFSAVTAACLVVARDAFNTVNGFNEKNLSVAFNDVDLCLKLSKAGYLNIWTPFAELYHYESISRGYEHSPEKFERFESEIRYMKETWGDILKNDPFYNPNLTIQSEDFNLAYPSRFIKPWTLVRR